MRIFKLSSVEYREYNSEWQDSDDISDEDWTNGLQQEELYDQGVKVFNDSEIRPDSTKDISDLVIDDGKVIGSTSSGWNTFGEESIFAFDIAIKDSHRSMGIGKELVKRAISKFERERSEYEEAYGNPTVMILEAVNIRFGEFIAKEFNFEIRKRLSDRIILYRK